MIGKYRKLRSWTRTFKSPFQAKHYIILLNLILRVSPRYKLLSAYLWGNGQYPREFQVRAFGSKVVVTIFNAHDAITLIEVFCREDYKTDKDQKIFVDVGANIGIASLYFLMSNPQAIVYAYEPCRSNLPKLSKNLENFRDRVNLSTAAMDVENGIKVFREEITGRYGGFSDISNRTIFEEYPVQCMAINEELLRILNRDTEIDLLKLDVEGIETKLLQSIAPDIHSHIKKIYYESNDKLGKVVTYSTDMK